MKEAIEIVHGLNADFWERTDNDEFFPAKLETDGGEYAVLFLGWPVFQSGNDSLDEDSGQTLEQFIMAGVNNMIDDICKLKETP